MSRDHELLEPADSTPSKRGKLWTSLFGIVVGLSSIVAAIISYKQLTKPEVPQMETLPYLDLVFFSSESDSLDIRTEAKYHVKFDKSVSLVTKPLIDLKATKDNQFHLAKIKVRNIGDKVATNLTINLRFIGAQSSRFEGGDLGHFSDGESAWWTTDVNSLPIDTEISLSPIAIFRPLNSTDVFGEYELICDEQIAPRTGVFRLVLEKK